MKAKYDFRVMPDLQGKEEEQILYPQLVTSGTITLKDLMQRASKEERFQLLVEHLEGNGFITCKKYSELTGLLKNKASAELRTWAEEGRILREGRAPHVVYRKLGR